MRRKESVDGSGRSATHSIADNAAFLLRDIWQEKRQLCLFIVLQLICGSVLPLFTLYLPKLAVDLAVEGAAATHILTVLGTTAAAYILISTVNSTVSSAKYIQYNFMRTYYQQKILYKTLDCDYDQIESGRGQTRLSKARMSLDKGDWSGTSRMITAGMTIITSTVSFVLYSGVIARLNMLIVLGLAAVSAMNYFSLKAGRRFEEKNRDRVADLEKKLRYIETTASDIQAAKDVRVYSLADWFLSIRDGLMRDYKQIRLRVNKRQYAWGYVTLITNLLRDCLSYGYLIHMVISGGVTPGDAVLYFGAITGFSGWIGNIVTNYNTIAEASSHMNDMRTFLELSNAPEPRDAAALPGPGVPLKIEFQDVSFAYEDGVPVLNHFSLTIDAGEKLALVGVNGAGKTTVIKLLLGFYQPDSGQIRINGINIARFCKVELYTLFSAVFQDLSIFAFGVAENISLQPESETDFDKARGCLEKVGLLSEIEKHSGGMHAKMLKDFDENGIVLSGGQQQKLLMARALYKDAPILLLDEPTAALDPIAESEVYEQFHQLSQSKTAIYISHRLASTKFCDKIAFLDHGIVAEQGTHEALMRLRGAYASMFDIQSHYYREGVRENAG